MKFWILLTALIAVNVFGEVTGIQVPEVTVEPVTVTVENPVTVCTPVGTTVPVVDLPEVSNPADRIGKVQNFLKMALAKFRDQRNWKSDRTFGIDSEIVGKWVKIYEKWRKSDMSDGSDGSDGSDRSAPWRLKRRQEKVWAFISVVSPLPVCRICRYKIRQKRPCH